MSASTDITAASASHTAGTVLVVASAAVFSLSGVFTKALEADIWTIACWRGLIGAAIVCAYVLVRGGDGAGQRLPRLGWRGWVLATVGGACSVLFIASFKLTYVANVAVIYATVPFAAAALAWPLLGERIRGATLAAAATSFAGVGITVCGGLGAASLLGDGVAVAMMLGNGLYMVLAAVFAHAARDLLRTPRNTIRRQPRDGSSGLSK